MRKEVFLLAGLSFVLACSTSNEGGGSSTGGTTGTGGTSATGGTSNAGGTSNSGGSTNTGGSSATGGTSETGGKPGTGGSQSSGGNTGTAGKPGNGGNTTVLPGTGGKPGSGGNTAGNTGAAGKSGGTTGTAGKPGNGGSTGAGGSPSDGGGTAPVGCDRAGLQAAVDAYLAAVQAADTSKMPLDAAVKYYEVATSSAWSKTTAMGAGLWATALPVKFSRSLLDTTACLTFTEIFITAGSHPYVLGTKLTIKDGKIAEIFALVSDSDDWNFDATAYDTCSESEDWAAVPAAKQNTREECIAAGEAYFEIFSDKNTTVPWGNPCYRLEGGKGCTPQMDKSSSSCNVGIPDGITFKDTTWVADGELNACVGVTKFASASPDSHMFRLVDGKIRYVHTITIMK